MSRYTSDSRERVRDAVDFVAVVQARTELRRAGPRRYQGLCPFHEERTPSFGIDPVEKLYHCFGCGAGGDLFKFVMETEGLDFAGALESLADRHGVTLEREAEDPRDAANRERRDRLFALLDRTATYYQRVLWESDEAEAAKEYLASRGLEESVLQRFRVGFAPDAWDRVLSASRRNGYTDDELLATSIAVRSRSGRIYDRFRGRIIFPWSDARGRVRGFGARALTDDQQPKYLNSSDSEVFQKGRWVYGADVARAAAAREGTVLLVEGYTDALALHQAGFENVVGSMGTALTEQQVGELLRLAPTVLLALDSDAAGGEATERAASMIEARQRSVRVVTMPSGEDPADVVVNQGRDVFARLVDQAVPSAKYRLDRIFAAGDLGRADERERALSGAAQVLRSLPPSLLREDLVALTAERLVTTPELINEATKNARGLGERSSRDLGSVRRESTSSIALRPVTRREQTERAFLAMCIALPDLGKQRLTEMDVDELFSSDLARRAATYLRGRVENPGTDLPEGDSELTSLIAELVVRAGELEVTPELLELESLQLELAYIERAVASMRAEGGDAKEWAAKRQLVQESIRERLQ